VNYLAHLYLAGDAPEALIGNLMGDFARGSMLEGYSEGIREGIRLHRKIDAYTDTHPVVIESKRRISPANRRYAGILIDVFYDHFLARDWETYSPLPLADFTAGVYDLLRDRLDHLPEPLQRLAPRMIAEDWLTSYAELPGIEQALRRVARRLKRENQLPTATVELEAHYNALAGDFARFFPDLRDFVGRCGPRAG
jgi:acyl carrier protein phosphodiesterase